MRFIILFFTFLAAPVFADYELSQINSYRCGNKLGSAGMTEREVLKACGNKRPVGKETWSRVVTYGFDSFRRNYEGWLFQDYGKFDVWVVFSGGQVVEVLQSNERN